MTALLELKQRIKNLYSQYEIYILPVLRFVLAMVYFIWINTNMGYMKQIDNIFIVLILALICSILPSGVMIFVGFALMVAHGYALGIEVAGFMLVLILFMAILFLRFSSDNNLVLVFTPLSFGFSVPTLLPIGSGLLCNAFSALPAGCGVIIYYFIRFIRVQHKLLENPDVAIADKLKLLTDGIVQNWGMWITVIAFIAVILLVNLIRTRSFDYAWRIAIIAGGVVYVLMIIAGGFYFRLDIDVVTDIFIRINSKGTPLSQGDFVMSKMAADEIHGGNTLRKLIDYFSHLSVVPTYYEYIKNNDTAFAATPYLKKLAWLADDKETVYDPGCDDVIRVAFMHKLKRARLADLVLLLTGRDFETREYKDEIAEESFKLLHEGVLDFVNETNYKRFIMIIKSSGIIDSSLVRSQNVLNFAYTLYLTLKAKGIQPNKIENLVRRWLVLSILTGRYSSSPESAFDYDIKRIVEADDIELYIKHVEDGELSDAFWNNILVTKLNTSVTSSPYFNVYLMAQIRNGDRGFLSSHIDVKTLIEGRGDVHHIFPKKYLQKNGEVSIVYELIKFEGPPHRRKFYTKLIIDSKELTYGEGYSKKESEQNAAKAALEILEGENE